MPLLLLNFQRICSDFSIRKSKYRLHLRKQVKHMLCGCWMVLMVVRERKVFVVLVVFLVVLVFGVVQSHEVTQSDFLAVAGDVVDEMVNEPTQLHHRADALPSGRAGRQHQQSKGYEQEFFHQAQK